MKDIEQFGAGLVIQAIADTHEHVDERRYRASQKAALKWNGYAHWALPNGLYISKDMLRLVNGVYFRAWVCRIEETVIDGHVYVNQGSGCCQVCGE